MISNFCICIIYSNVTWNSTYDITLFGTTWDANQTQWVYLISIPFLQISFFAGHWYKKWYEHWKTKVPWQRQSILIVQDLHKSVSILHSVEYQAQLFVWRSWFKCVGVKTIQLSYIFKLKVCYWKFKYRNHVFFKCATFLIKWNVSCSNSAFYTCIWYYVLFKIWRKKCSLLISLKYGTIIYKNA